MEQVVSQCRHLVASGVALDMLHRAMLSVLLWRTAVAIETAGRQGAIVCHRCLICIIIHSYKTMLWSIKINRELDYSSLICYQLVCTLLAAADGNGRRFGHHCCRQTSQIREHAEVDRN